MSTDRIRGCSSSSPVEPRLVLVSVVSSGSSPVAALVDGAFEVALWSASVVGSPGVVLLPVPSDISESWAASWATKSLHDGA
ncbi:hypothetical protein [Nannocystis pusilla]|uniref:hypothetical protein n=1 Tax=Nannocystis pusilla TaxID=889268 RepID=UPI003DA27A57